MLSVRGSKLKLPLFTKRRVELLGFRATPTLIVAFAPFVVSFAPGMPIANVTGPKVRFVL